MDSNKQKLQRLSKGCFRDENWKTKNFIWNEGILLVIYFFFSFMFATAAFADVQANINYVRFNNDSWSTSQTKYIVLGDSFTITVQGRNDGEDAATDAAMFIGLPSFDEYSNAQYVSLEYGQEGLYHEYKADDSSDKIFNVETGSSMTPEYLLVRYGTPSGYIWPSETNMSFDTQITPQELGYFYIQVKCTMYDSENATYSKDPTSGFSDQQGENVYRYTVYVEKPTYTVSGRVSNSRIGTDVEANIPFPG